MSSTGDIESRLNEPQEELYTVVEPLVDSVSELVLAAVTKQFGNVQGLCQDISERTTVLVTVAQQVATSSTDIDVQMEVAGSINEIAETIEALVVTFTALLSNSNPATQEQFALAAKNVGDAINRVCQSTDQTSERKIQRSVQECAESTKQVVAASRLGKEKLLPAAQINVERTVKLVKICVGAAAATSDEKKAALLKEGSDVVKFGGPALIGAAKSVTEGKAGAEQNLAKEEAAITRAYEQLLTAAAMGAKTFGKAAEMYEYIKQLIQSATDLSGAAQMLMELASSGTQEQFMNAAKMVAGKALEMVRAAEAAMAQEQDPVKKQLIKDAANELRAAAQAYIAAAKAYRENPTPENKAKMEAALERLQNAMQAVIAATKGEFGDLSTDKGKLALSSAALESAAKTIVLDAKNNPGAVEDDAMILVGIAEAVANDLERIAATETDPRKKALILQDAANIRKGAAALAAAAKHAAANPNDAAAQAAMDKAHQDLLNMLEVARKHAGLIPGDDGFQDLKAQEEAKMIEIRMQKGKEAQALAAAAQEQAATALRLADEAEALAQQIKDPVKRAEILGAIKDIRTNAARVIAAAEKVLANPGDMNAQAELQQAQKDLNQSIHKVVVLTGAHSDADVAAALRDMLDDGGEGTASAVFAAADRLLGDFVDLLLDTTNMDPKEVMRRAKELSENAKELIKQLRAMAAVCEDPVMKEKLLTAANLISDNSMQVKILAMVRASAQSPDKSNAVGNAARLLQTNIKDIIREVKADQLRTRFRNTVRQTMAMHRVMNAWNKGAAKV